MEKHNNARRVCAGLFVAYVLVMVYLLFLQREPSNTQAYNLIPFQTIRQMVRLLDSRPALAQFAFVNLVGNVVMFVPLGLLPVIWKKQQKFGWYVLTVAVTILLVEVVQLFTTLGSADIDDWIFNMIGALMGFGIWRTIGKIFRLYQ